MEKEYYTPFSEQRRELRKKWNLTNECWEEYLKKAEKNHQNKNK